MEDKVGERNTVLQDLLWKWMVSMSELKEYINEQLNDPEFKKMGGQRHGELYSYA